MIFKSPEKILSFDFKNFFIESFVVIDKNYCGQKIFQSCKEYVNLP
jgi:hypothetical protein